MSLRSAMAEIWIEGLQKQLETPMPTLFAGRSDDWVRPSWYRDWPLQLHLFDPSVYYVNTDDDDDRDWWDDEDKDDW